MPGNTKSKGTFGKKVAGGKASVKEYTTKKWNKADSSFHIKLKHVLGAVSLLSLLAAFEVFSIPAGSGIIDFLDLARISAALVFPGIVKPQSFPKISFISHLALFMTRSRFSFPISFP